MGGNVDLTEILGWLQTTILTLMLVPQIYKTLKSKSVKDISLTLFISYLVGNIIALIYGYRINQFPLITKY